MRSAWRTVEKRCETRIVVRPARRGEDALEDLGLAAHVELGRRLVEQHDAGAAARPRRGRGPGRRAATARRTGRCRRDSPSRAGCRAWPRPGAGALERGERRRRRAAAARRHVVAQRQLEAHEVLEHRRHVLPPVGDVERPAGRRRRPRRRRRRGSYSRHSSLASVVLPAPFWPTIASDEPAGIVEVEAVEHERAAGVAERHVPEADLWPVPRPGRRPCRSARAPAGAITASSGRPRPPARPRRRAPS